MNEKLEATMKERNSNYGLWKDQARIAQEIKRCFHRSPNWKNLNCSQLEALEMVAHKISRILNGKADFRDSWHDLAGYAELIVKEIDLKACAVNYDAEFRPKYQADGGKPGPMASHAAGVYEMGKAHDAAKGSEPPRGSHLLHGVHQAANPAEWLEGASPEPAPYVSYDIKDINREIERDEKREYEALKKQGLSKTETDRISTDKHNVSNTPREDISTYSKILIETEKRYWAAYNAEKDAVELLEGLAKELQSLRQSPAGKKAFQDSLVKDSDFPEVEETPEEHFARTRGNPL